jgi:putative transcriptional regulator
MQNSTTKTEIQHGGLDPVFPKKGMIKTFLIVLVIAGGIGALVHLMMWGISRSEGNPLPTHAYLILWGVVFSIIILVVFLDYLYNVAYLKRFSYGISSKFITINSGVFTHQKTSIPFSRIQNITVEQGIIERLFGIYTVKIETAGVSGISPQTGTARSEGYIPGVRDPSKLEKIINELVHEYTQMPMTNLKGKVFDNPDLAFDEFAAYFLQKMNEGGDVKNLIADLRKKHNLSQEELAEKVGVSRTTIYNLERGKFQPSLKLAMLISKTFKVKVDELFELESADDPTYSEEN